MYKLFIILNYIFAYSTFFLHQKPVNNSSTLPAWSTYGINASSQTETNIKLIQLYAAISQCSLLDFSWICTYCKQTPYTKLIGEFKSVTANMVGYVAFVPSLTKDGDKAIIVSFRGAFSSSFTTLRHILMMDQTLFLAGIFGFNVKVHRGLNIGYMDMRFQIYDMVESVLKEHPDARLVVTGYSMGSMLATMAGMALERKFISLKGRIEAITFGGPRIGNRGFALAVQNTFGDKYFRVTSSSDPIPHLFPRKIGKSLYQHAGIEYWITPDAKRLIKCDDKENEDMDCSNSMNFEKYNNALDFFLVFKSSTPKSNGTSIHMKGYWNTEFTVVC